MKWKSGLVTDLSGSFGGLTASRNRGGNYFRSRVVPINPNTPFQASIRAFVASLTSAWVNVLTPGQRSDWNIYAGSVQIPDTMGDPRNVSGIAMYVRSNVPRLQAALARLDAAPPIFGLGLSTQPTFENFVAATNSFDVAFNVADAWVGGVGTSDGAAMLVLASRPQNPSVNFFKGPYRFAGLIAGNEALPPTSPATIFAPFNITVGQRIFVQTRVTQNDGRLNLPFRGFGLGA